MLARNKIDAVDRVLKTFLFFFLKKLFLLKLIFGSGPNEKQYSSTSQLQSTRIKLQSAQQGMSLGNLLLLLMNFGSYNFDKFFKRIILHLNGVQHIFFCYLCYKFI